MIAILRKRNVKIKNVNMLGMVSVSISMMNVLRVSFAPWLKMRNANFIIEKMRFNANTRELILAVKK